MAIVRALITRPEVIFADEPTGALDPHTTVGVLRHLRGAADGTTVVIVTHDPQVTRFCDRAVFLHGGRVERVLPDPEPPRARWACASDRGSPCTCGTARRTGATVSALYSRSLAVATAERRRALRLLGRVGASRGQVAAAFGWHALFVTVTGVIRARRRVR